MAHSSCKRDTKSKSHPGVKLAPVRVFSCKHPLTLTELESLLLSQTIHTCVRIYDVKHRLSRVCVENRHERGRPYGFSPSKCPAVGIVEGIFTKSVTLAPLKSIPSTFIAATRAPRAQLTVKHVVKLPNQVYKNLKQSTLTTHGHGFRQPKCTAVRMFHPYWFFCYHLILKIKLAGFVDSLCKFLYHFYYWSP